MKLQQETMQQIAKIPSGTVEQQSMAIGVANNEPLLIALDGMLRYAKAYRSRNGNLSDDGVLGPSFLDTILGLRALLNGDGAVSMEKNITTDSKDNGALEGVFWAAMGAAGFTEDDL